MKNILERIPLDDLIAMARRKAIEGVSIRKIADDYNCKCSLKGRYRLQSGTLRKALKTVPSKLEDIRQSEARKRNLDFTNTLAALRAELCAEELQEVEQCIDSWLADGKEAANV